MRKVIPSTLPSSLTLTILTLPGISSLTALMVIVAFGVFLLHSRDRTVRTLQYSVLFPSRSRSRKNRFLAGCGRSVVNVRQNIQCISFQCAGVVSGLIDRAVILLLLNIVSRIGKRSDDGVVEHFVGAVRGRCSY